MIYLKQSTASQNVLIGPFVDDTDGNTAETGLTISNTDIRLSKNGANIVGKNSGGGTHDELGYYQITLDATDTNTVGRLQLMVHESGALPVYHEYQVLEEDIYDALIGASAAGFDSNQRVDVGSWIGTAVTLGSGAPDVNIQSTDNIDLSATQKTSVNAECDTALTDYDAVVPADLPTNFSDLAITVTTGEVTTGTNNDKTGYSISGTKTTLDDLNDVSTAEVNAEADTALTDYDPPTRAELTSDINSLNDPTAATIADAVWDEAQADHTTANTFGETATEIASILADTNELQTDDVPGLINGLNDLSAAQVNAQVDASIEDYHLDHLLAVDYDPATKPGVGTALLNELVESDVGVSRFTQNALEQAPDTTTGLSVDTVNDKTGYRLSATGVDDIWDESTTGHTTSDTFGEQLKTDVDAILADTNELQTDWANGGRLDLILDARASQSSVDTVDGNVDSILADTGTDGVQVADKTGYRLSATGVDDIFDEVRSGHSTQGTYGESFFTQVSSAVNDASATTTSFVTDLTEATDDHYNGLILAFVSGNLAGQKTDITDYNGTSKTISCTALTEAPANNDRFIIY